jgi:hypothetical protein
MAPATHWASSSSSRPSRGHARLGASRVLHFPGTLAAAIPDPALDRSTINDSTIVAAGREFIDENHDLRGVGSDELTLLDARRPRGQENASRYVAAVIGAIRPQRDTTRPF